MNGPVVAAITLHPAGGGVAAVARLLWQVVQTRWGGDARLITLLAGSDGGALDSSTAERVRFGARVAMEQVTGRCPWVFYSHLSLAKVQRYVPAGRRHPYMVFLHGIEAWRPLSRFHARLLARAVLRVANSHYTADRVRQVHPEIGPVATCPLALPPPATTGGLAAAAVELGPHAVVIVARMSAAERYKGHDALLAAWPAVRARQHEAQLVFVGGGDDEGRLRAKAAELGLAAHVLFTGFVGEAELGAIYARAAVFAMPSRGEGFGIAYLEAMAHAIPCIGSIHDAAREVIDDGVTGFLVDQADPSALADRISDLLGADARRREMGQAGRRRLEARFTIDRFAARLGELIEGVLPADDPSLVRHRGRSA